MSDQLQLFMDVKDLLGYVEHSVDSHNRTPGKKGFSILREKLEEAKGWSLYHSIRRFGIAEPVCIWHNDGEGKESSFQYRSGPEHVGPTLGNGHHRVAVAREIRRWRKHVWVPVIHNDTEQGIFVNSAHFNVDGC